MERVCFMALVFCAAWVARVYRAAVFPFSNRVMVSFLHPATRHSTGRPRICGCPPAGSSRPAPSSASRSYWKRPMSRSYSL
jgi:hypothetical protein